MAKKETNKPIEPVEEVKVVERTEKKARALSFQQILFLVLFVGAIILSSVLFYMYHKSQEEIQKLKHTTQTTSREETKQLISEVGKLIRLPENEEPTIATITDPKKLDGQQFFKNAKKDDKVLLFVQAKRVILYRPSAKQIIEVARMNGEKPSPSPSNLTVTPQPSGSSTSKP